MTPACGPPVSPPLTRAARSQWVDFFFLWWFQEALLGKQGDGFKIAMMTLDAGRIGIASQVTKFYPINICLKKKERNYQDGNGVTK